MSPGKMYAWLEEICLCDSRMYHHLYMHSSGSKVGGKEREK